MGTRHYTRELYVAALKQRLRDHAESLADPWRQRKVAEWFISTERFSARLNLRLVASAQYWVVPKN